MRISVKTILIGSVALLAVSAAGQGAVSVLKLNAIQREVNEVATDWLPSVNVANALSTATRDVRVKLYRFVVASESAQALAENEQSFRKALKTLDELRVTYEPLISSPEERAIYEQFGSLWARYTEGQERIVALMKAGQKADALDLTTSPEMADLNNGASRALQKTVEFNRDGARVSTEVSMASAASAQPSTVIGRTSPHAQAATSSRAAPECGEASTAAPLCRASCSTMPQTSPRLGNRKRRAEA